MSTVVAAVPIDPPVKKLAKLIAELIVEPELVRLEARVSPLNVGVADVLMFWIVLISPEPLSEKLVELKVAIPRVDESALALLMVIVPASPVELDRVSTPV